MAKSAKGKKAKKADFQKVKLKVGKKLKKAQNETKTDFRARKIILKEQLAVKPTQVLVTKKRHDVKELLSRLSYHNVYVRQDGVNGLKELVNHNEPPLLLPHLSTFVVRATPCILDPDPLIRTSVIKFLEALIMKMGPSIEPYFHILATHLSCAMVHLNVGVQGDSLQLMKVLIRHTPKLVARHANTVLNNFISLIARKTSSSSNKAESKQPTVVNFNFSSLLQAPSKNPLAGHAGRLSLLVELSNFLEAILEEQRRIQDDVPYTAWETVVIGSVPPLNYGNNSQNKLEELWLFSNPKQVEEFTVTVVRLLMQLWLEVDSNHSHDSSAGGNALNEEGVETLSCIVNIIMHLWKITQICTQEHPRETHWIKSFFGSDFMKRILSGFPFCCQVTPLQHKKRKKAKDNEKERQTEQEKRTLKHCDDLNVLLALFGTQMYFKGHQRKAMNFFTKLLRDGNRDGQYNMSAVVNIIIELLPVSKGDEVSAVISAAHTCFSRLHHLKKDRALLLDLLLATTDMNYSYMWRSEIVSQWIEDIVNDLVSGAVREPLLKAAISLRLLGNTNIKPLLLANKAQITESVTAKGVQGMTAKQIEQKLSFLLKD
ncbi:hypothetical protein SK128_015945 [Halocaridina rubra]|uniref:Pre-rRNA-processing protein Ipi1 N-terminal domain-containing protein n=1 Tax=Halocaridina rubra TaxID=373956 RepID=A0AAN8ZX01_HALRR